VEKLAGGHIVLANHTVAELYNMAQAGKIRVLAVVADERSPYMPDVPTTTEAGVPGLTTRWWTGVSLPKGTPQYIVDKWAKTIEEMTKDQEFLAKAEKLHVGVSYLGPEEYKDYAYKEAEYYTKLATKIGVRK
jgi:tripartite-type tricarboxylate transporter receptor subunit TctC